MLSPVSLLVLAVALTANAQDSVGVSQCVPAQIGVVPTSHPVKLPAVVLQPSIPDFTVSVPHVPECLHGVSGAHAYTCDVDVQPTAFFTDAGHLRVHRNGNLQYRGTVVVTVYCNL